MAKIIDLKIPVEDLQFNYSGVCASLGEQVMFEGKGDPDTLPRDRIIFLNTLSLKHAGNPKEVQKIQAVILHTSSDFEQLRSLHHNLVTGNVGADDISFIGGIMQLLDKLK